MKVRKARSEMAKLSNRTFGVEFELFFTEAGWDKFQNDYSKFLDDGDDADFDRINYAFISSVLAALGFRGWKVVEDGSIDSEDGNGVEAEIVTPILRGSEGLKQVYKFCTIFREYAKVNESTGVHVHVDAADFKNGDTAAERLALALLHYGNIEEVFDSLVMAHRRGKNAYYARPTDDAETIIEGYKEIIAIEANNLQKMVELLQGSSRYKKINLRAILSHGTIEFRQMHGTLNPELVKNWIIICTSFMDQIIEVEKKFTEMFQSLKNSVNNKIKTTQIPPFAKVTTIALILYYLHKQLIDLVYDPKYSREPIKQRINGGKVRLAHLNQFRYSNILPDQEINGTIYAVIAVPLAQIENYFIDGDPKENISELINYAKQKTPEVLNNCIFVLTPDSLIVKFDARFAAKASNGSYQAVKDIENEKEVAPQVKANPVELPTRNVAKLQKQTATSPLKEKKKKG